MIEEPVSVQEDYAYFDLVPEEPPQNGNGYHRDSHKTRTSSKAKSNGHQKLDESTIVVPLETFDLANLLREEFEPLQWIIPDYLPEGLTLLFSRPKVGKSMLALALSLRMARRVAGGVDGTVLYLSLDDTSKRRLQSRTRDLLQGVMIENSRIWAATQARTLDANLTGQLHHWMKEHPDTRLVVIDVYARIKPKKRDDDVYKSDYEALIQLQEFAVKHHLAIILVHHTRKQADTEDWIDNINGSTGLAGAVDTIWMLVRSRGSTGMKLRVTGRDVRDCDVAVGLDDLDMPWIIQGEDSEETTTSEQKILSLFNSADCELAPKGIAQLTQLKPVTVRSALRRMLAKNLVTQTTYGSYRVARVAVLQKKECCNTFATLHKPTSQASSEDISEKELQKLDIYSNSATLPLKSSHKPTSQASSESVAKVLQSVAENESCNSCNTSPGVTVATLPSQKPKVIPHCKHFLCMVGPHRTEWRLKGYYCPVHGGWIDEKGRPL